MDKREHIMNVAVELFAVKGFEATSIRELAAKAEVNVAMVNYYFGSKEKLFEAMVQHKADHMKGRLAEISQSNLDELEKIDAIIVSYVERLLSQHLFHRVVHQELLTNHRFALQDNIMQIFKGNLRVIKEIILAGIKKKVFRKVEPELTIATILGTINQVLLSTAMCKMLIESDDENFDPYTDVKFKQRIIKHIQDLIHAHLLIK